METAREQPAGILVNRTSHRAHSKIALHRHAAPYAALVVEGSYEEFSVDGVWSCEAGDLVVHPAWHLHANRFRDARCTVLNFAVPFCSASSVAASARVLRLRDPGTLLARRNVDADSLADAMAEGESRPAERARPQLERLARALLGGPEQVAALAAAVGLSREHLARLFRRQFGLPPRVYRAEGRLRRALQRIADPEEPLAAAACASGYADQAHFTRCVRAATGMTPGEIRRCARNRLEITFVQ